MGKVKLIMIGSSSNVFTLSPAPLLMSNVVEIIKDSTDPFTLYTDNCGGQPSIRIQVPSPTHLADSFVYYLLCVDGRKLGRVLKRMLASVTEEFPIIIDFNISYNNYYYEEDLVVVYSIIIPLAISERSDGGIDMFANVPAGRNSSGTSPGLGKVYTLSSFSILSA